MKKSTLALTAVALALAAVTWWQGWLEPLSDPERIRGVVAAAGVWAPIVFFGAVLALFPVFMVAPAVWASAALWPLPFAFSLSYAASVFASVITHVVARRLGAEWAHGRVPASIRRWEDRLREQPFWTLILLRALFWANPLVDIFAAVSGVSLRAYLLTTILGLLPPTAFQIFLGAGGFAMIGAAPAWGWALAIVVTIVVYLVYQGRRLRR